jgi:predicted metal-dependent hydrolase
MKGIVLVNNERYAEGYLHFLMHFHGDRDYFECHEILEAYWKEHPESPLQTTWVGLIQAAVGMYHYRRGNFAGAKKSIQGSILRSDTAHLEILGLDATLWIARLHDILYRLDSSPIKPYIDIDIPISDVTLLSTCQSLCMKHGYIWGAQSDINQSALIHRHTLRDRSDVIEQRRLAKDQKSQQRDRREYS